MNKLIAFLALLLISLVRLSSSFRSLSHRPVHIRASFTRRPTTVCSPVSSVGSHKPAVINLQLHAFTLGSRSFPKSKEVLVKFALALTLFAIGNYVMRTRQAETAIHPLVKEMPISIFINGKSGGKEGRRVIDHLLQFIPKERVCDLSVEKPTAKLAAIHTVPRTISPDVSINTTNANSTLVLCCGGDGTMKWIMEEAKHLNISQNLQFGLIPMGTGNDLANHIASSYLDPEEGRIARSILNPAGMLSLTSTVLEMFSLSNKTCKFDRWQLNIVKPVQRPDGYLDSEAADVEKLAQTNSTTALIGKRKKVKKLLRQLKSNLFSNFIILPLATKQKKIQFNNYFGIGIDGEITSAYDSLRRLRPYLFFNRLVNKFWYVMVWIYTFLRFRYKSLSDTVEIYCDGQLVDIKQQEFRGIILTNINSYAGGCKLWEGNESWRPLSSEDGMIEIVGLSNLAHLAQLTGHLAKPIPIAQGRHVKIISRARQPMQVDGEPWIQAPCVIDISSHESVDLVIPQVPSRLQES